MKITDVNKHDLSSAMQQYYDIKINHLDKIIFFQLGDFFEMFFEDALEVSNLLEMTLTQKAAGLDEKVPMAGIPISVCDEYIAKLMKYNKSVVVVVQEEATGGSKIINRKINRIITPGTYYSDTNTDNNFISVVYFNEFFYQTYGDLNTGEMYYCVFDNIDLLFNNIINNQIKEVIDLNNSLKPLYDQLKYYNVFLVNNFKPNDLLDSSEEIVKQYLLNYLKELTQNNISHLREYKEIQVNNFLKLSVQTQSQLELIKTLKDQEYNGSLFWFLNKTSTAMGRRKLRENIIHPLTDQKRIEKRLDVVELLLKDLNSVEKMKSLLTNVYDFERLISKISNGSINPKEIVQLKKSLNVIPELKNLSSKFITSNDLEDTSFLYELLNKAIIDNPGITIKEGGFIKDLYNEEIDYLKDLKNNSALWLSDFEERQRKETNIKSLKIKYNKIFGYFIEVTNSFLHLVPESYTRKQTMATCERYITSELKEKENEILSSSDKLITLENKLLNELKQDLKQEIPMLTKHADFISNIDVYISFALLSAKEKLTRPTFNEDNIIDIKEGFHPIIRSITNDYVNNYVYMDDKTNILLITGPNMAGKSTYMRQLIVCSIMAQIGCFVPASSANIMIFDQIFTRIGSSDDLIGGKSTFMVEMTETAYALNNATNKSLLIFDELGRGTSTYDGISLAQSIIEYIDDKLKAKTMFSTHYHELTTLEQTLDSLKNVHVFAKKHNNTLEFFHEIREGAVEKSYGIDVAKLADLPYEVINRSNVVLKELQSSHNNFVQTDNDEIYEEEVIDNRIEKIRALDIDNMTPMEALKELENIKNMYEGE